MIKLEHLTLMDKITYIVCGLESCSGEDRQGIRTGDHSTCCNLLIELEDIYKKQLTGEITNV